jgi:hypothetical protein
VENQNYELAHAFYEKASLIQPYEVKYPLMMASCKRRNGHVQAALSSYKNIHEKFPENVECLKFIIRMTSDMGLHADAEEYQGRLSRLENKGGGGGGVMSTSVDEQITELSTNNGSSASLQPVRSRLASAGKLSHGSIGTGRRSVSPPPATNNRPGSNRVRLSSGSRQKSSSPIQHAEDDSVNDEDVTMFLPD